jgi:hypothetical protein
MAKHIKPVALLTPTAAGNKNSHPTKAVPAEVSRQSDTKPATEKMQPAMGRKLLGWSVLMVILALLLIPKPELIVYQQQNIQAKSIYWSGIFGLGAGLNDSQMLVFLDDQRREMRLCYAAEVAVQCSKYHVIHRGGVFEVGRYLLDRREAGSR